MWKRDEAPRPTSPAPVTPAPAAREADPVPPRAAGPSASHGTAHIGKSVVIKGELTASEDLTLEGQVEGKIELRDHVLTVGPNGKVKAQVFAKTVVVEGDVRGNISATERVDIRDAGSVEGDLSSPRVAIADGAHFRGSIDMQQRNGADVKSGAGSMKSVASAPAPVPAIVASPASAPLLQK